MKKYIGCDAHARYSVFVSVDEKGQAAAPVRVAHGGRDLRDYLGSLEPSTPIVVDARRRMATGTKRIQSMLVD
jgi:hypothetical protein